MAKIINKILKQLTPERIKKEVEAVEKIKLPLELKRWVDKYRKVGERDDFIWKWTYLGMEILTLSSVAKKYKKSVCVDKTISIILNVLLDDIADKRKDKKLLEAALNICLFQRKNNTRFNKKDLKYLNLIKKIWDSLNKRIKKYPRYKDFKDLLLYDYQQFLNAMRYSYLINKNYYLINLTENKLYLSHNMQGIISATIDLMASPKFNMEELGFLREVSWRAQRMGRIGNSITTWEREIDEKDFSSEVFAYAIMNNFIQGKDLKKDKKKIIQKIKKSQMKKYSFDQWKRCHLEIIQLSKKVKSVNIKSFLSGLEKLITMHLISKGFK